MKAWRRRVMWIVVGLLVAAVVAWAFMPQPVPVELTEVQRGPMQVTVDEDGQTRVRERYIVSSPLAGRLQRVPWEVGDAIAAGETVLARIAPQPAQLLDPRARAEAAARVQAAEAALAQTAPRLRQAQAQLELAQRERERLERLRAQGAATERELDDAALIERVRQQEQEAGEWAQQIARYELDLARAALMHVTEPGAVADDASGATTELEIRSPVDGQVLRVMQESATVVSAGTALMEVGDPNDLEVLIDVLSRDAVRIQPGDAVHLEGWGGEAALRGVVRRVEPSAFTRVSALGVEEQRVNIIIDFVPPPPPPPPEVSAEVSPEISPQVPSDTAESPSATPAYARLGDGYRVDARIVVWQADDVVKVPTSALFRHGDAWAVFVIEDGRAARRPVRIGQRNPLEAQVLDGLSAGEAIIAYPSDRVTEGTSVVGP